MRGVRSAPLFSDLCPGGGDGARVGMGCGGGVAKRRFARKALFIYRSPEGADGQATISGERSRRAELR